MSAQESGKSRAPTAPPPPVEEKKPLTPSRIRVGCAVQQGYAGPAAQWFNPGPISLSDAQIANLQKVLSTNPEDICARGYLIAHGQGYVSDRMDHVLWMVQNHPEWDGFMLNLSGYPGEQSDRLRAAWLQQVGPDQRNGTVFDHAAVFFEWSEPDFAEALLERAIRLEPDVPLHVESLGRLYGRSQYRSSSNLALAARAKSTLLSSTDWLIVAGALNAISSFSKGGDYLGMLLRTRLRELVGDQVPRLPSMSDRYRSKCDPVPLLRRCIDTIP